MAERTCVVCGNAFMPKNDQVRTCGRVCGGKARFSSPPVPRPVCRRCGEPRVGQLPGTGLCSRCWLAHGSLQAELRTLGLPGNKHIPVQYLRASITQRRALLAGILDTDGTVTSTGSVQLAVTNQRLAEGVRELVLSLGYRCSMTTKRVKGRHEESSTCYMVNFTTPDEVFRLPRKEAEHQKRLHHHPQRTRWRYIVGVRRVPSVPVRCVQVDNADQLYLAGRGMVPTHNSTLALDLARSAAIRHNLPTVIFSLEMSRNEITMRLLSAESRVSLHSMRTGQMGEEDWATLARRMSEVVDAPLYIDDSPNMSMMEIRAKCRRLKQRQGLRMVIIDYLQLMSSPEAGGEPAAGSVGDVPVTQAAGQGDRRPGHRALPAQPGTGTAQRQEAPPLRPARIRVPDGGNPDPSGRHGGGGDAGRIDGERGARRPGLVAGRAVAADPADDDPRLPERGQRGVPGPPPFRPRGAGHGQPPVPHPSAAGARWGSWRSGPG